MMTDAFSTGVREGARENQRDRRDRLSNGINREWMGLREVTQYANVSNRTLRLWIHSPVDPLPAVKVSGKHLVRRSELDAWLGRYRVRALPAVELDRIVRDVLRRTAHGR
ncbi:MAG: helix-turn-helix domain-containing protein [Bryobacteraceae bacterium]